jgi:hypothetical protein
VEVRHRQEVLKLSLGPQPLVEATTARAVPVAAGVVGVVARSTAVAERDVATQSAGAAGQDVGNGLALFVVEMPSLSQVLARWV